MRGESVSAKSGRPRPEVSFARQRITSLARIESQFEHAVRNMSFGGSGFCRFLIQGLFFIFASV